MTIAGKCRNIDDLRRLLFLPNIRDGIGECQAAFRIGVCNFNVLPASEPIMSPFRYAFPESMFSQAATIAVTFALIFC